MSCWNSLHAIAARPNGLGILVARPAGWQGSAASLPSGAVQPHRVANLTQREPGGSGVDLHPTVELKALVLVKAASGGGVLEDPEEERRTTARLSCADRFP